MKKRLALLLAVLMLLCYGCASSLEKTYTVPSERRVSLPTGTVPEVDNEAVPATEIDIHVWMEKIVVPFAYCNGYGTTLPEVAGVVGMDCLRRNEGGTLYSLHKVKQGGWLLIFYRDRQEDPNVFCWYYVNKALSLSDFSSLEEGDSFNKALAVDPNLQIFRNLYNAVPDLFEPLPLVTYHYLSDGYLQMGFEEKDGTLSCMGKASFEGYSTREEDLARVPEGYVPYDCSLIPTDRQRIFGD